MLRGRFHQLLKVPKGNPSQGSLTRCACEAPWKLLGSHRANAQHGASSQPPPG